MTGASVISRNGVYVLTVKFAKKRTCTNTVHVNVVFSFSLCLSTRLSVLCTDYFHSLSGNAMRSIL